MGKPAARQGDMHICPKVEPGPTPHVGGPIAEGSPDVIIGGAPAARVGDMAVCTGPPDKITQGSPTVFINYKPAARMGDSCEHGGTVVIGCSNVIIGDSGGPTGSVAARSSNQSRLPKPPHTKEEALNRLDSAEQIVKACRTTGSALPQSPFSTADKVSIVKEGLNEKFIVRVIERKYAEDSGMIGKPPEGTKATTYWTTTFTQVEHADKDAELLTKSMGVNYKPDADYTLLLIDQENAGAKGDMVSFIPTYENLGQFAEKELAPKFEGYDHLIAPCMTPEYSRRYEHVVNTAKTDGIDLHDKDMFNEHAKSLGYDEDQRNLLRTRHQLNNILGANEHFLGNGMTKDNTIDTKMTPFGKADISHTYGILETFTYDKNPQTLGKLEKAGIVNRIPLNKA